MNGIILNGKVYEAVTGKSCESCAFKKDVMTCRDFCDICEIWGCAFRLSQNLTDKINKNDNP